MSWNWLTGGPVDTDRRHLCPECRETWRHEHICFKTGIHYQYNDRCIIGFYIQQNRVRPLTLKEWEETGA